MVSMLWVVQLNLLELHPKLSDLLLFVSKSAKISRANRKMTTLAHCAGLDLKYPILLNGSKYIWNSSVKKQENVYVLFKKDKTVLESVNTPMMILERLTHETKWQFVR